MLFGSLLSIPQLHQCSDSFSFLPPLRVLLSLICLSLYSQHLSLTLPQHTWKCLLPSNSGMRQMQAYQRSRWKSCEERERERDREPIDRLALLHISTLSNEDSIPFWPLDHCRTKQSCSTHSRTTCADNTATTYVYSHVAHVNTATGQQHKRLRSKTVLLLKTLNWCVAITLSSNWGCSQLKKSSVSTILSTLQHSPNPLFRLTFDFRDKI